MITASAGASAIAISDEAGTARLGAAIAARLGPGMLVLLEGDLGAGKTALARAIVRTLLGDEALEVPSPSFALVQPYDGNGISLLHADFYRLADASETQELGLFDDPSTVVLVEWPERDPSLAGAADLVVALRQAESETGRLAVLSSPSGRLDCGRIAASL
ncbi:MAG: tRNA (adenosine(37)-N6)-threonylcarbamoyltransferase complex ATPase subunit type 1 TsaE [Alphaproteobacteria bacterium]|nr:tRNA (adenosine(37)-N6)-threonylcarbamoyltransferase complex ATPase subunit type 1 TsaE [Alphaproteobacteria bacterium]